MGLRWGAYVLLVTACQVPNPAYNPRVGARAGDAGATDAAAATGERLDVRQADRPALAPADGAGAASAFDASTAIVDTRMAGTDTAAGSLAPTRAPPVPTAGLIGHWAFEEGTGSTTRDLSGNANALRLIGNRDAIDWRAGRYGSGVLTWNDVGPAWLDLPASSTVNGLSGALTLGGWVYHYTPTPAEMLLAGRGDGQSGVLFGLSLVNGRARLRVRDVVVDAPSASASGTWTHVLGSFDGQRARLYVDGTLAGEAAATPPGSSTADLSFGALATSPGGAPTMTCGRMVFDEWVLYNRALSDAEIAGLTH